MFTALLGLIASAAGFVVDLFLHISGLVMNWSSHAHRALAFYLRTLLILSLGITLLALGLGWLFQSPYPSLLLALIYALIVPTMFVGRAGAHAFILLAGVDILLMWVRGAVKFHSYNHANGMVQYQGTDFLGELQLSKAAARFIGWVVMIQLLALLVIAIPGLSYFPAIAIAIVVGLILHAIVQVPGFQNTVKPYMVWSLVAAFTLMFLLSKSAYVSSWVADWAYSNRQTQQEAEFVAQLRSDIDKQQLGKIYLQIRALEFKDNNGTITAEERKYLQYNHRERIRLEKKADNPLPSEDQVNPPATGGAVAGTASGTTATGSAATAAAMPRIESSGGLWGRLETALPITAILAWIGGSSTASNPEMFFRTVLAIALIVLLILFLLNVRETVAESIKRWGATTDDERTRRKTNVAAAAGQLLWLTPAILLILYFHPTLLKTGIGMADSIEAQNERGRIYAAGIAAEVAANPPAPAAVPSSTGGRGTVLAQGEVTAAALMADAWFDTRLTVNRPVQIFITDYSLQNGSQPICGAAGCTAPQLAGQLMCPADDQGVGINHMSVIGHMGPGTVSEIGQQATYQRGDLPVNRQTLKLGINQTVDPALWANMTGGFKYMIVAVD